MTSSREIEHIAASWLARRDGEHWNERDQRRLDAMGEHALVMHPGPMNRGLEISADAADSPRSVVVEQVSNGVAVRMAVLYLLLAGANAAPAVAVDDETKVPA